MGRLYGAQVLDDVNVLADEKTTKVSEPTHKIVGKLKNI